MDPVNLTKPIVRIYGVEQAAECLDLTSRVHGAARRVFSAGETSPTVTKSPIMRQVCRYSGLNFRMPSHLVLQQNERKELLGHQGTACGTGRTLIALHKMVVCVPFLFYSQAYGSDYAN